MESPGRVFDDLAKVANGAVSTVIGMKQEIDQMIRQRLEKLLTQADLVPREEFEAVQAMAAEARAEQIRLEKRILVLEERLEGPAMAPVKKASAPRKATAKTSSRAKAKK